MGGEKQNTAHWSILLMGSPPRGRGKDATPSSGQYAQRSTPAWAGKRRLWLADAHSYRDHPRVGGEKGGHIANKNSPRGSPPRGRGKAAARSTSHAAQRITPAGAGKRLKRSHRSGIFISGPIPFHSVLHRPAGSGGSRAGRDGSPAGQPQNAGPAWAAYSSSPPTPYGGQGAKHRCCGW